MRHCNGIDSGTKTEVLVIAGRQVFIRNYELQLNKI